MKNTKNKNKRNMRYSVIRPLFYLKKAIISLFIDKCQVKKGLIKNALIFFF